MGKQAKPTVDYSVHWPEGKDGPTHLFYAYSRRACNLISSQHFVGEQEDDGAFAVPGIFGASLNDVLMERGYRLADITGPDGESVFDANGDFKPGTNLPVTQFDLVIGDLR